MPQTGELARAGLKTSAREHVDNKDVPIWRTWLDALDPFAFWLVRTGAIAGGLALAYLLYAIFGGNIGKADMGNIAQAAQNVTLAGTVLRFSLVAIALSLIVLMFDEKFVGVGMVVLGVALEFGSPLLIKNLGVTQATNAMAKQLMTAGHLLMVAGLLKASLDSARWLFDLPSRMKQRADVGVAQFAEPAQQRAARNATMFSPCWHLPFCREVIRKQCPAFLAKTACWKFGRGCYCDEEMISRIIRGEGVDLVKAPTRMSRQGKPPCGRCYIFLEHQTLKYKLISPLAIPATIGVMFVAWDPYKRLFGVATHSLGFLWEKLSFASAATTTVVTETIVSANAPPTDFAKSTISPEYVQQAAQNMFGFLIGFFVLIYISKFIEWAIFKAKL